MYVSGFPLQVYTTLTVNDSLILWPGNQVEKPVGVNVSNHLRVVTIEATPFVYTEPYDPVAGCNSSQLTGDQSSAKMRCPKYQDNGSVNLNGPHIF